MDENKDIEKVSHAVFDNLKTVAPDNAWDKLDADLDKKQAVVYKQRANRFKLLSIALALFIFSFLTWQYLAPSSTTKNLANVTVEKNTANDKTFSNVGKRVNNSESNIPSENFIPTTSNKTNNNNPKLKNSQLTFEVKTTNKKINKKLILDEKQNNTANLIKFPTEKNENITKSNSTNAISNEFVNVANDSDKSNATEQNILSTNIPGSGLTILTDTNKSEPPYFVKNDSLFKKSINTKPRLSIAVYYSPNKSWCNLKDNTADNFDDVAIYNNRENSKFSFTTGLTLKYDLSDKWSLLSGVTYSTIAKSITIQTMYAEANADNQMHFQYSTSNGVIEMPYDDALPNLHPGDSINVKAVCNQSIKFINVPLMVRFQITKKKFTWYTNGGLSANFIAQEKAKININNSETTIINHINGLKKMNYGFLLGAGVQYNLYNDLGIFIEPVFRGSLTSITHNTAVNSYPYSLGLNLGFSLHL